jgi:hypothetical protein
MGTLIDRFDEHDGPVRGVHFHKSQPCLCLEVSKSAWIFIACFVVHVNLFFCISEIGQHFETDHQGSVLYSSINWMIDMGFNGYIFISWNGGSLTPW